MKKPTILLVTILAIVLSGLAGLAVLHKVTAAKPHSVALSWHASPSIPGTTVVGYNVYRSTTPGGPYFKIGSKVPGLTYTDWIVNGGTTYFYVVTAVDQTGRESKYSTELTVVIP